jgi:hypothetical protein
LEQSLLSKQQYTPTVGWIPLLKRHA